VDAARADEIAAVHERTTIHWLGAEHLQEIVSIEQGSFESPLMEPELRHLAFGGPQRFGVVALLDEQMVVGYLLASARAKSYDVTAAAVDASMRRLRIGTRLFNQLSSSWASVSVVVRERNTAAQMFLRFNNFKVDEVLRGHWSNSTEDAYLFVRRSEGQGEGVAARRRLAR
jgi:[ribosomal protein S18]-alanine N-acetyltransferase